MVDEDALREKLDTFLTSPAWATAISLARAGEDVDVAGVIKAGLLPVPQQLLISVQCVEATCPKHGKAKAITAVNTDGFYQLPRLLCASCLMDMEVTSVKKVDL